MGGALGTAAVALAAVLLLFVGVGSGLTLAALRRIRLQPPTQTSMAPQDVPEEVRALLAPGLDRLIAMGFGAPTAIRQLSRWVAGRPMPMHALVLAHARVPAVAYLHQLPTPDGARHYGIYFVSQTRSGITLLTRNRASIAGPVPVPAVQTHDCWRHTWRDVWRSHRRRMRRIEPDPAGWQRQSMADWIARGAAVESAGFEQRVRCGDYVAEGDGRYRLGLRYQWQAVGRAWRVWRRSMQAMEPDGRVAGGSPVAHAQAATSARRAVAGDPADWSASVSLDSTVQPLPTLAPAIDPVSPALDPAALDAQVRSYEVDLAEQRAQAWSRADKWRLFLVTGVAAAASFGMGMSWPGLAALMAVLLFHEMGHLLAMRQAGYQDLKVFFLPFVGAAASGRHERPTVVQELVVLFAGPVPGLLLGLAAWLWLPAEVPGGTWWREMAVMAVVVNALNLLPVHPLDGGKILEIVLLSRWPRLAFAGRVLGMLLMAALALTLENALARGVMLGVILLAALGTAHRWREATLARALQREGLWGALDREQALRAVFGALARRGWITRPWPEQRLLVTAMLPGLTRPVLRLPGRLAGVSVYLFFLLLPVGALVAGSGSGAGLGGPPRIASPVEHGGAPEVGRGTTAADAARAARAAQAARDVWRVQRERELADLRRRVAEEADPSRRWTLLELELGPLAQALADDPAGSSPAFDGLLAEARALADRLPDPLARRATVELWVAESSPVQAERRARAQAVFDLYAQAPPADVEPLLRATEIWAGDPLAAEPAQRLQRVELSLDAAQGRHLGLTLGLQRSRIDLLLALQDGATARGAARQAFEASLSANQPRSASALAQLWVDATLATQGLDAALQATELALSQIEVTTRDEGRSTAELRRQGLWLAEAERRPDWQRVQVTRLPPLVDPLQPAPWWLRAMAWATGARRDAGVTPEAMERAHWQGRTDEARRLAAALAARSPHRRGPPLAADAALGPSLAARLRVIEPARRSVYERYGLPAAAPASSAVSHSRASNSS